MLNCVGADQHLPLFLQKTFYYFSAARRAAAYAR